MDYKTWILLATLGTIIAVPAAALISQTIAEALQLRRNRIYKTLADHTVLNASDRETWMSGRLVRRDENEEEEMPRFSQLIVSIAQLATVVALAVVVVLWNESLSRENAKQEDRLSQVETQLHALAFVPAPQGAVGAGGEESGGAAASTLASGNPMQQACSNLIGRIADAYEKGRSSKIAESLEGLMKNLGCQNAPPP